MVDLAMHMMDIVQNAIRANATRIDIGFLEESRKGTLTFTVSDNGSGMVPETVEKELDHSSQQGQRRIGLRSATEMTSEQSGGSLVVPPGREPW